MTLYVIWYYMNNAPSSIFRWGTYADNSTEAINEFEDYLIDRGLILADVTIYNLQERKD